MAKNPKFHQEDLNKVAEHFHELLFQAAKDYKLERYRKDWEELPKITNDLIGDEKPRYFAIPGMYGGFAYSLTERDREPLLTTESWVRIVEGSEKKHEITVDGFKLISK